MDDRTPNWGIEPGAGAPARARVRRPLPALEQPLGQPARDRRGRRARRRRLRARSLAPLGARRDRRGARSSGTCCSGSRARSAPTRACRGWCVLRAPLGQRGSYLPTFLNVVQNLGWSIFELLIIATAAAALSDRVLGFHARWLWTLLFGGISVVLALLGPIGFVRRYVRKFAIWVVLASLLYLTWWVLDRSSLSEFWHGHGHGGSTWAGFDLVLASIISWTPLAADYTRFAPQPAQRVLGNRRRLLRPDDLDVRARRAAAPLARHQRRGRDPRGGGDAAAS